MRAEDVILTDHAISRGKQLGLNETSLIQRFIIAIRQRYNPDREIYKIFKYGKRQNFITYFISKGTVTKPRLLFTARQKDDKWLILTVTRKSKNS